MPCLLLPSFFTQMERLPDGHSRTLLGSDGVLRSIENGTNKVIDVRPLTPDEIKTFFNVFPPSVGSRRRFENIDGTLVTSHDDLYNPAPDVMIPPTDEAIANKMEALTLQYMNALDQIEDFRNPTPAEIMELRNQMSRIWLDGQVDAESIPFGSPQQTEDWNIWCQDTTDFYLRFHDDRWDEFGRAKDME